MEHGHAWDGHEMPLLGGESMDKTEQSLPLPNLRILASEASQPAAEPAYFLISLSKSACRNCLSTDKVFTAGLMAIDGPIIVPFCDISLGRSSTDKNQERLVFFFSLCRLAGWPSLSLSLSISSLSVCVSISVCVYVCVSVSRSINA